MRLLSQPVLVLRLMGENLVRDWQNLSLVAAGKGRVTFGLVWPVIKGGSFLLFIFAALILVLVDTVKRVFYSEIRQKTASVILTDMVTVLLVLFIYYLILCGAIYAFFNLVLPIKESL